MSDEAREKFENRWWAGSRFATGRYGNCDLQRAWEDWQSFSAELSTLKAKVEEQEKRIADLVCSCGEIGCTEEAWHSAESENQKLREALRELRHAADNVVFTENVIDVEANAYHEACAKAESLLSSSQKPEAL